MPYVADPSGVLPEARAFWVRSPGRGEILPVAPPEPGSGDVVVRTLRSGVSRGTRRSSSGAACRRASTWRCGRGKWRNSLQGHELARRDQVKQVWSALAEETVAGLPAETVTELPGILTTITANVDSRRAGHPHRRWHGRSTRSVPANL
jgi:hypothetical protein